MLSPNAEKIALNAVCSGAVAAILMRYGLGEVESVEYLNMNVSAPMAVGLAAAGGSIVSDVASEAIIKRLGITNQMVNASSMLVNVSVGGAATAATLYFGGSAPINVIPAFGIGAVAKLGGDYSAVKLFDPREGIISIWNEDRPNVINYSNVRCNC